MNPSVFAEPPPLPGHPTFSWLLFESPWWVAGLAAVLLLAFSLGLRSRGLSGAFVITLAIAPVVGVGLMALSGFVVTPRERLALSSSKFLEVVSLGDAEGAGAFLATDLVVDLEGTGRALGEDRATVLEIIPTLKDQAAIEARRVRSVALDGAGAGRAQVFIRTGGGGSGFGPSLSWWLLSWREDADGEWRIHLIELLLLNGQKPKAIADEARRLAK